MDNLIAYCGIDCGKCDARKATLENDIELKKKVAKKWSDMNKIDITPEMINCTGCRVPGPNTPFCDNLCEIKKCASQSKVETCADCKGNAVCEKIKMIIEHNDEARKRILK